MEKKRICLITNWYPTRENPYQGIFFKEQAIALSDFFDFTVVHYYENRREHIWKYFIRKLKKKTVFIEKIGVEKNIIEYNVSFFFPRYQIYTDKIGTLLTKILCFLLKKNKSIKNMHQMRRNKVLIQTFSQYFKSVDVLYCVKAQQEGGMLHCIAQALDKPYIVSEHAPFPYPGEVISEYDKIGIENANMFFAISYDKIRQVLVQNVRPKKIGYVANYVDEDRFLLSKGSNDRNTFVIVAAYSFYKNYDLFIEIFDRLTEITPILFRVMIVGYGANKGYSQNMEELEEKIKKSKFAHCAEMIPEVNRERMNEVYAHADAFVMTSIQEGMPVSALEAGCCGLPIFSTMCGGIEDYVDDKIGRVYRIIDSEAFATGLKDYLENKIEFDNEYIREYIIKRFGKKAFTERMTSYFTEVIREGTGK